MLCSAGTMKLSSSCNRNKSAALSRKGSAEQSLRNQRKGCRQKNAQPFCPGELLSSVSLLCCARLPSTTVLLGGSSTISLLAHIGVMLVLLPSLPLLLGFSRAEMVLSSLGQCGDRGVTYPS